MASSDDFKEAIKAGKLNEALMLAMSQAIELKITTWVAPSSNTPKASNRNAAKPGERLHTRVNLMQSAIENEVGERFVNNNSYQKLQQFHQQQVAESSKIIYNNIQSLQKLFEVLSAMQQKSLEPSADDPLALPKVASELFLLPEPEEPQIQVEPSIPETPQTQEEIELEDIPESEPETRGDLEEVTFITPAPTEEQDEMLLTEQQIAPPTPEMPVYDLEIEDWEDTTETSTGIPSGDIGDPILSLEDLEPDEEDEDEEEGEWIDLGSITEAGFIAPGEMVDSDSLTSEIQEGDELLSQGIPETDETETLSPEQSLELEELADSSNEEDWDNFIIDEIPSETSVPDLNAPGLEESEEWEEFTSPLEADTHQEPLDLAEIESASNEEDWGDFMVDDVPSETSVPDLDAPELEASKEWEEFAPSTDAETQLESSELEALTDSGDEDWDDFMVDEIPSETSVPDLDAPELEASEEVAPSTATETQLENSELEALTESSDEDWDDFMVDEIPSETSVPDLDAPELEASEEVAPSTATETQLESSELEALTDSSDEDWDDFMVDEIPLETSVPDLDAPELEASEEVAPSTAAETQLESSELEALTESGDEDWDDFMVDEIPLETSVPDLDAPELEASEEVAPSTDAETQLESSELEALTDSGDEDWGDFMVDEIPSETSVPDLAVPESEILTESGDEDWDDFMVEEVPSETSVPDLDAPELEANEEVAPSIPDLTAPESEILADSGDEEDWGDFMTENVPSEPSVPDLATPESAEWGDFSPSTETEIQPETSELESLTDSNNEEDWDDFISETPAPDLTAPESEILADSGDEEDWGDFMVEEAPSTPSVPDLAAPESEILADSGDEEDWDDFIVEEVSGESSAPESEILADSGDEEDWGDFMVEEAPSTPSVPDLAAPESEILADSGDEEDWSDEWIEEEITVEPVIAESSSQNNDWEDFESLDPFATPSVGLESSSLGEELEEDWDNFAANELEPYPNAPELTPEPELETFEDELFGGSEFEEESSFNAPSSETETQSQGSPEIVSEEIEQQDQDGWDDSAIDELFSGSSSTDEDLFEGLTVAKVHRSPEQSNEQPKSE
ncbi:hypothetical protein [Lusitaniella coriacea]|uniref:hypothetical protein n=1 Tax=Lusitaniella coriacea TaxID=1983105 RepID=UPI003CF1B6C3